MSHKNKIVGHILMLCLATPLLFNKNLNLVYRWFFDVAVTLKFNIHDV